MGYSIMTPFKSRKSQQKMLDFLTENFRGAHELSGKDYHKYLRGPIVNKDISYGSRKERNIIGFDYTGVGFCREYGFRICSWMAVTEGKRKIVGGREIPFMIYDGEEDILLLREQPIGERREDCVVTDEVGFYQLHETFFEPELSRKDADKLIQEELNRLSKLYRKLENGKFR